MDNSFSSIIDSAGSVLILLPVKPSFDQVTAGLSLYLSLNHAKNVNISCPTPMTVGMNRLVGVNKISSELGNKNLTMKFKGYDATNIEKVSYDIIDGEFNLTVVPKTSFTAPQKEQIEISYAGVSADLVILIGGVSDSDFPILETQDLGSPKIIHIGTRDFSSGHGILSFAKPASTISELVAVLIKENNLTEVDPDVATNLVMGIEEGSSKFSSPEVTPETFETFAWLLRNGGQRQSRVKLSPVGFPPGSIPNQPFGQKESKVSQVSQVPQVAQVSATQQPQIQETDAQDAQGTQETEQDINPPDDWLQPKVFKSSVATQTSQPSNPDSFSENKG